jgi:hypothetical protein
LFTVDHLQFTVPGSIIAIVSVLTTTIYQTQAIVVRRSRNQVGIPPEAVARFVLALIASLLIGKYERPRHLPHDFHIVEAVLLLLSGGLAIMGNCARFSMIRQAGAITFQVCGHVATMMTFLKGVFVSPEQAGGVWQFAKKICGLHMSIGAVVWYTLFEMKNHDMKLPPTRVLTEQSGDDPSGVDLIEPLDVDIEHANREAVV